MMPPDHELPAIGIGLMCKPPRAGVSKTRLAKSIGSINAAKLARAFLQDTAHTIQTVGLNIVRHRIAFYRPEDASNEIADIIGEGWIRVFCDAGDLGASMFEALEKLLEEAPGGAILLGADLPTLPQGYIEEAMALLGKAADHAVVLGPSFDGGYYLIGIRSALAAPLFEPMPWSTPQVLSETLRRASDHGLVVHTLPIWRDIDDENDLDWLIASLKASEGNAPATRAALSAIQKAAGS